MRTAEGACGWRPSYGCGSTSVVAPGRRSPGSPDGAAPGPRAGWPSESSGWPTTPRSIRPAGPGGRLLADRADITEELVRLVSHLDQARCAARCRGAVERRLDSCPGRSAAELNTIGAKSTTVEISAMVVSAKATLEKLR